MSFHDDRPPLELPTRDDRLLWDVWLSSFQFPTLVVADELGLFVLLESEAATAAMVAQGLSLGPRATEALLGVLTSLGFLARQRDHFHLTEVARHFLLPDSPYYWGPALCLLDSISVTPAGLRAAMKPEGPADQETPESHEHGEGFTAAMHSLHFPAAMGVALHGDFTGVRQVLDVGGGSGCFCIALALRYPQMRFTVMELPLTCQTAEKYIAAYTLQERIDTRTVDMWREPWPTGYDALFFGDIFHDWNQERCRYLTKRSFDTLPSGGRIYLHEMLLDQTKAGPLPAACYSMLMRMVTDGKQYSAGELERLLQEAGFEGMSVTPTYGYYSLVSARKP
jgi:hypothetical protein